MAGSRSCVAPVMVGQRHRRGRADEKRADEIMRFTVVFSGGIDGDGGDGRG